MRYTLTSFLLGSLLLLGSCSGGSASASAGGTSLGANQSEVAIALSDSGVAGLSAFEVDLVEVSLVAERGAGLRLQTDGFRVDLLDLARVSELVAVQRIDPARIESLVLGFDFSNALVAIDGQAASATVLDADGVVVGGRVDVQVFFDDGEAREFGGARRHLCRVDLDLESAVFVDATTNTVIFSPAFAASTSAGGSREFALRGVLSAVSLDAGTVTVERVSRTGASVGEVLLSVDDRTQLQIDGVVTTGLGELENLRVHVGTRVAAEVRSSPEGDFVAARIAAGYGVLGNGQDWVRGHVLSRDVGAGEDPVLTVLGSASVGSSRATLAGERFSVSLSLAGTRVLARGGNVDADAINVGQNVLVFGGLSGNQLLAGRSGGVVELLETRVRGTAEGVATGDVLTVNVERIGPIAVGAFDFVVGGRTQSDPEAYSVGVAEVDASGVGAGDEVRVRGIVNPVDVRGDHDFEASRLVSDAANAARLMVLWKPASTGAVALGRGPVLDLNLNGTLLSMVHNGSGRMALAGRPAPSIRAAGRSGRYRIVARGQASYRDFAAFALDLDSGLAAGAAVHKVMARGRFDERTQVFAADDVKVELATPRTRGRGTR